MKGEPTLEAYFRRWLVEQTERQLVVRVPIERHARLLDAIQDAGGKVVG